MKSAHQFLQETLTDFTGILWLSKTTGRVLLYVEMIQRRSARWALGRYQKTTGRVLLYVEMIQRRSARWALGRYQKTTGRVLLYVEMIQRRSARWALGRYQNTSSVRHVTSIRICHTTTMSSQLLMTVIHNE